MFGALKRGRFWSLASLSYTRSECCWRTSTKKNTCGIARFPCGSTAFLLAVLLVWAYQCISVSRNRRLISRVDLCRGIASWSTNVLTSINRSHADRGPSFGFHQQTSSHETRLWGCQKLPWLIWNNILHVKHICYAITMWQLMIVLTVWLFYVRPTTKNIKHTESLPKISSLRCKKLNVGYYSHYLVYTDWSSQRCSLLISLNYSLLATLRLMQYCGMSTVTVSYNDDLGNEWMHQATAFMIFMSASHTAWMSSVCTPFRLTKPSSDSAGTLIVMCVPSMHLSFHFTLSMEPCFYLAFCGWVVGAHRCGRNCVPYVHNSGQSVQLQPH